MFFLPALKGLFLGLSLIVAIGPQNAFLLRQAVRREKAWLLAAIFLFGDATMILLGGFGIGELLGTEPWLKLLLTVLGALYILRFGVGVLRQMDNPKILTAGMQAAGPNVIVSALAVTFLNPHAIFDTVILVGTLALQFQGGARAAFMAGAVLASTLWFFGLAWIGQTLAPFLSRPKVWRVIDGVIVIIMFAMAATLGCSAWQQALILMAH